MGACHSDDPHHARDSTLKFGPPTLGAPGYDAIRLGEGSAPMCPVAALADGEDPYEQVEFPPAEGAEFATLSKHPTLPPTPCSKPDLNVEALLPATAPGWMRTLASEQICRNASVNGLHQQAKQTLQTVALSEAVCLPPGVDREEWMAAQALSIFEEVFQLVALLDEICTADTCPTMQAGRRGSFKWHDESTPAPVKLSAPSYMQELIKYAHRSLQRVIPQEAGPFPEDFYPAMQRLHSRFFRVYAHTYIHHLDVVRIVGAQNHLNCCFKHLLFFAREFDLISQADLCLLRGLVDKFEAEAKKDGDHVAHEADSKLQGAGFTQVSCRQGGCPLDAKSEPTEQQCQ